MHLERLRIDAFGRLTDFDTGEEPLPALVVVHGPNESGKTTFFRLLTTLLYGFKPASSSAHPYAPWNGRELAAEARFRTGEGVRSVIRRVLAATANASLVVGDREFALANRPLDAVAHVPRAVFRQVFALTLAEMAGLQVESWSAAEERLVGGLGARDLKPARDVAERLERDAGRLWRPNRRGKQRVRRLRGEAATLRQRRERAQSTDDELRAAVRDLDKTRNALRSARDERASCRAYVERFRLLEPIRRQLRRIEALRAEAGDAEELKRLPHDPRGRLETLEAEVSRLEEVAARLAHEEREPRERLESFGVAEQRLARASDVVRTLLARVAAVESERIRRAALAQEVRDLERRASGVAGRILESVSPEHVARLAELPTAELRDDLRAYRSAVADRRVAEEAAAEASDVPAPAASRGGAGPAAAVILGAAGTLAGWLLDQPFLLTAGAASLAVGATAWISRHRVARSLQTERERAARADHERAARLESLRREEANARERVLERFGDLPVRDEIRRHPDSELVTSLERLREMVGERTERETSLAESEHEVEDVERGVKAIAEDLAVPVPDDPTAAAHLLSARVRDAERREESAASARREIERTTRERRRVEAAARDARSARDALVELVQVEGPDGLQRGLRRAEARLEAHRRARQLRDELDRSHHDLDEIIRRVEAAEAAGEDWTVDDEAFERRRAREEELNELIEQLTHRSTALAKDVERLREQPTPDQVGSELLALEEELAETIARRDRAWVLARILREAERRVRDTYGPDLMTTASENLELVTDGRYRRILLDGTAASRRLLLGSAETPRPLPVEEPFSTGIREQLYLSVRLALVDQLDRGGERLPLFVDEILVNWDAARLRRGMDLLERASRSRQVFVFTCHADLAESLVERGAARVALPS